MPPAKREPNHTHVLALLSDVQAQIDALQAQCSQLKHAVCEMMATDLPLDPANYPYWDTSTHEIRWRGRCAEIRRPQFLALAGLLFGHIDQYVPVEQMIAVIWSGRKTSDSTVRTLVYEFKRKLRRAGMPELAANIRGTHTYHYGLILRQSRQLQI